MMKSEEFSVKKKLLGLLCEKNITFSAAESCTGGLVLEMLTSLPGASSVILGGVVSYSNSVKENVLGVPSETLERFGAVSRECALEMAEGVRRITGSDISVSVTGIAGPDGGTPEKPVGTVCFGVSYKDKADSVRVNFDESLSRDEIRMSAANYAMELAANRIGCDSNA